MSQDNSNNIGDQGNRNVSQTNISSEPSVIKSETDFKSVKPKKNKQNKNKRGDMNNSEQSAVNNASANNKYSFVASNLSTYPITKKFYNRNLIIQPLTRVSNSIIEYNFSIRPDEMRLKYQSQSWARGVLGINGVKFNHLLSGYKSTEWQNILEQVYIYSYFKSLLYGAYSFKVKDHPVNACLLAGHCLLYHTIVRSRFNFEDKTLDVGTTYSFNLTDDDVVYIEKLITDKFKFLKYQGDTLRNTFEFINENFDRILLDMKTGEVGKRIKFLCMKEDIQSIETFLSQRNFPVANSFYSKESNMLKWYYSCSKDHTLLTGSSLFGKALFVTLRDEENTNYLEFNNEDDFLSLVPFEVTHICGYNYPMPKS